MSWKTLFILVLLSMILAACGGKPAPFGDLAAGEALFKQATIDGAPGCATCHSTEPDVVVVGPSLAGVASRAGERVERETAGQYLRNSILNPNAYVVEGFSPGTMYQEFASVLNDQQVDDLVAYLLTLK
ncbi:MAG: c-type cytochrome [Anaerolineales bacterium]|jgi:cytochrome c2